MSVLNENVQAAVGTPKGKFYWEVGVLAVFGLHAYLVWKTGFTGRPYSFLTQSALVLLVPAAIISLLAGGWNAQGTDTRFRWRLLVLLVGVTICYLCSPCLLFLGDCGARKHVAQVSEETRLQNWADELFQCPRSQLAVKDHFGSVYILDPHAFPGFVRNIPVSRGGAEYCLVAEENGGCYLTIAIWQGRPHSWGVLLCPRNHKPPLLRDKWLHRWREGVYGWQDQNENS